MDAISQAARNVSVLTCLKLEVPPVPLKSIRKQDETNVGQNEIPMCQPIQTVNVVKVYEVWKVFLEESEDHPDEVYVVIDGDYTQEGYGNGTWSDVEYRGFYTTLNEAQNEISGYLR